jgi:hypothetical protein
MVYACEGVVALRWFRHFRATEALKNQLFRLYVEHIEYLFLFQGIKISAQSHPFSYFFLYGWVFLGCYLLD